MTQNFGGSLPLAGNDFTRASTRVEQEYRLKRASSCREEVNPMRFPID
jgi:hypothetical protein